MPTAKSPEGLEAIKEELALSEDTLTQFQNAFGNNADFFVDVKQREYRLPQCGGRHGHTHWPTCPISMFKTSKTLD